MPKRTWQPSKIKRRNKLGFLKLMRSNGGQNRLKRRRLKGRLRLTLVKK